ncbi:hypothetical protein P4123_30505 [Pseudomonas aeruginosa]|nr:hypothetical protein [Pseudomonas aeruginosa]
MCTALVSAIDGIPVRADVATTGEITLRGSAGDRRAERKTFVAHRGGIKTVIIPEEKCSRPEGKSGHIKSDLVIKPVKWIDAKSCKLR